MASPKFYRTNYISFDGEAVSIGSARIMRPAGEDGGRCSVVDFSLDGVAVVLDADVPFAAAPELLRHIAEEIESRLTEFNAHFVGKRAAP